MKSLRDCRSRAASKDACIDFFATCVASLRICRPRHVKSAGSLKDKSIMETCCPFSKEEASSSEAYLSRILRKRGEADAGAESCTSSADAPGSPGVSMKNKSGRAREPASCQSLESLKVDFYFRTGPEG